MLFVLFSYIFNFPVLSQLFGMGSNFVIGFFLLIFAFLNNKYRAIAINLFNKKYILIIFSILTIICLYSLVIPTILDTDDYSIIPNFISQYFTLSIGIFVFALYIYKARVSKLPLDLIYIYFIQGCIQLVSLLFPSVNIVLNNFRTSGAVEIGQEGFYDGIRGLSISGQAFFGLGVGYALIFILILKYWSQITPQFKVLRFVIFSIILFGGLSAARVSLVGLIIGSIYKMSTYIYTKKSFQNFRNRLFKFYSIILFLLVCAGLLVLVLISEYTNSGQFLVTPWRSFSNYSFEFLNEFVNSGRLSTTSTDILFNRMYFPIESIQTKLIGDGKYAGIGTSYYMNTDAGYMRNILYFGVIGIIILFIYQLSFFRWNDKRWNLFNISMLICILVLHIKGEVLGYSTMVLSILILILQYQHNFSSNLSDK